MLHDGWYEQEKANSAAGLERLLAFLREHDGEMVEMSDHELDAFVRAAQATFRVSEDDLASAMCGRGTVAVVMIN